MKLLLINYEYPPIGGGAGNATRFTARALADQGHEVVVLTSAWQEHRGVSEDRGVTLYRIPSPRRYPSMASPAEMLAFVWRAFFQLGSIAKRHGIEGAIIYFTIPNGPLGWWLKQRHGIPYVLSLRGGDVPGLVGEIHDVHRLLTPLRRMWLRKAEKVIANAEGLAQLSRAADPVEVGIIPNGVDAQVFHPTPEPPPLSPLHLLFVGRFHRQKNLPFLLSCLGELKKNGCPPFVLHMIGQGPEEEDLRFEQESLGLHENIEWHGWTEKEELVSIHQRCHLMLNPSLYEGLPNAVLEAMASGLPILVSDIPGNRDLVTPECGFSFSLDQADDFSEILLRCLEGKEDLLAMGQAARKRVMEHYTWPSVADRYAALFEKAN